ncbi:hypothetical protein H8959_019841 [Pygathrix nigripes]
MDFQERDPPFLPESAQSSKPSSAQQASELWEVVEEPRGRLGTEGVMPERQEGHLLKKRKWPLKGWHKRYFVLEDGILHYATTRQDITKGKLHGSIDVRLSVMSINKKAQRIDLDTEDNIYHLKIKSQDLFQSWVAQLRAHRLAHRLDMSRGTLPSTAHRKVPGAQLPTAATASALPGLGPREKVSSWLRDSDGLDRCSHAPGTTQAPPEPGVPAPNPLSPCYPYTPGKIQGNTQDPAQAPDPIISPGWVLFLPHRCSFLESHASPGFLPTPAPCPNCVKVVSVLPRPCLCRGGCHLPLGCQLSLSTGLSGPTLCAG